MSPFKDIDLTLCIDSEYTVATFRKVIKPTLRRIAGSGFEKNQTRESECITSSKVDNNNLEEEIGTTEKATGEDASRGSILIARPTKIAS